MLLILLGVAELLLIATMIRESRGTSAQDALIGWSGFMMLCIGGVWWEWELYETSLSLIFSAQLFSLFCLFPLEIRRSLSALNPIPRRKVSHTISREEQLKEVRREVINAAESLARRGEGALIVIEQRADLTDFLNNGVELNAHVRGSLIHAIFCHNGNDFHDGAIVIRQGLIWQAKAFLTMPHSVKLSQKYGTRHLAAVGITEDTDAVVIVVSEERKTISVAYAGNLHECNDHEALEQVLQDLMM